MRRHRRPLWLAHPGRAAGVSAPAATALAFLLGLLLALALAATPPVAPPAPDRAETVVQAIRAGGDYYVAAAQALRADGAALRPALAFPLPTLAVVTAALGGAAVALLLAALAIGTGIVWVVRLRGMVATRGARAGAAVLVGAGIAGMGISGAAANADIWAGLLVALSLALWRPDRWIEPAALALAAATFRESAALYVVAMAVAALLDGRRREALGWAATLAILAALLALHMRAAALIARPLDPALPWWDGFANPAFFAVAGAQLSAFSALPALPATLLAALCLAGWCAAPGPIATRMAGFLLLVATALTAFGRTAGIAWAAVAMPLLCAGLVFVPDLLLDLVRAVLDRPRVRVQRVLR